MLPKRPWHRPLSALPCRQTDPRQVAVLVQGLLQRFPGAQVRAVLEEPLPGSMNGKFSWYRSVSLQQHDLHRICTVILLSMLSQGSVRCMAACRAATQCCPALLGCGTSCGALGSGRAWGRCGHGRCRIMHGCARQFAGLQQPPLSTRHASLLALAQLTWAEQAGRTARIKLAGTISPHSAMSKAVEPTAEYPCPAALATPLASGRAFCCPAACPLPQ